MSEQRMRLAYRASERIEVWGSNDWLNELRTSTNGEILRQGKCLRELIIRSERFCVDNVAKYYAENPSQFEDFKSMVFSPPFAVSFYEWKYPELWRFKDIEKTIPKELFMLNGCLVVAADSEIKGDYFEELSTQYFKARNIDVSSARWILRVVPIFAAKSTKGLCCWPVVSIYVAVSSTGSLIDYCYSGHGVSAFPKDQIHGLYLQYIHVLGLTLSFLSCKNVEVESSEIPAKPRWHKQTHIPAYKFKTLHIGDMTPAKRRPTDPDAEPTGIKKSLHICRGHFSTYTEEKPLFGKYAGTFWVPAHTRGNAEFGIVDKDYVVHAGKQ